MAGAAPNRVFTIEWRVSRTASPGTANFQIRFFEGSPEFEIIYGPTTSGASFTGTIGVQRDGATLRTQFAGPTASVPAAGTRLLFTTGCCAPIAFKGAIGSNSSTTSGTAAVTLGTESAGPPTFLGTTMTVPLSGVADLQKITLTLSGVTNGAGQVL